MVGSVDDARSGAIAALGLEDFTTFELRLLVIEVIQRRPAPWRWWCVRDNCRYPELFVAIGGRNIVLLSSAGNSRDCLRIAGRRLQGKW
jgi:hypothetical protein